MSERLLVIIGAGGHGKAVAEAAQLSGEWQRIAFVDDRRPELSESFDWPVVTNVAGLAALGGSRSHCRGWQYCSA